MNEIAVIEQLPIITEKIKEIGENLDKRLSDLNLDELICNEETRKSVTDLRSALNKEKTEFEKQRKEIKTKILAPYEEFEKTYNQEIKSRYEDAIYLLDTKIDLVENGIKDNTRDKMISFFEEYRQANLIKSDWLRFEELGLKIGINQLTPKGELVKKVKDEIIEKITQVKSNIDTISTMEHSEEILAEFLKNKNLSEAIKNVNDRHLILEQVKRDYDIEREMNFQEQQVIEKVDEVLQAPIEGQMTIDDFEEKQEVDKKDDEIVEIAFKVTGKRKDLRALIQFMKDGGYDYESITD